MDIKIGVVGQIASGDEAGSYVKIVDDRSNTGGYLILTSKCPDMSDSFDSWAEDRESLSRYFEESLWDVTWIPTPPA